MKVEDWPTIPVMEGWKTLFEGKPREIIEQVALPRYLSRQRWFGSKSQRLEKLLIREWLPILEEPDLAFLVLVGADSNGGGHDLYDIPLAIVTGAEARSLVKSNPESVVAALVGADVEGILFDACASDHFCKTLLQTIAQRPENRDGNRNIVRLQTRAISESQANAPLEPVTRGSEEQSNTTIVFNHRYLLKLFRKLDAGLNPDFEIGRFLTEKTTFDRVPTVFGALQYRSPRGFSVTLALLQEFILNSVQAWEWMLGVIHRFFETARSQADHRATWESDASLDLIAMSAREPSSQVVQLLGPSLEAAALLGKRTAELHLALASDRDDPDFAPEILTKDVYESDLIKLDAEASAVFQGLREKAPTFDSQLQPLIAEILEVGPRIIAEILETPLNDEPTVKIRCHGDYHLGQVLRVEDDFMILDFEGEPGRTIEERRAKRSPWKDVAGMLRSFDYAAATESLKLTDNDADSRAALEPLARSWSVWTSAAFLKAYRQTAAEGGLFLGNETAASRLLHRFMIEKLIFEIRYESNYRPSWLRIPLLGLSHLSGRRNQIGKDSSAI